MKIYQVIVLAAMTAVGATFSSCGNADNYPQQMSRHIVIEAQGAVNNTLTLKVGETAQLKGTIQPLFTDEGAIAWASSDENVATVSAAGLVTAVAEGEAIIQATEDRKSVFGVGEIKVIVEAADVINVGGGDADQSQAD
jgi:transglutaminase/protease-like cytokinesis protein 3